VTLLGFIHREFSAMMQGFVAVLYFLRAAMTLRNQSKVHFKMTDA
jgi:hypothetical protein